jgi:hypothetical protein
MGEGAESKGLEAERWYARRDWLARTVYVEFVVLLFLLSGFFWNWQVIFSTIVVAVAIALTTALGYHFGVPPEGPEWTEASSPPVPENIQARMRDARQETVVRCLGYAAGALAGIVPLTEYAFAIRSGSKVLFPEGFSILFVISASVVTVLFTLAALSRLYILALQDRDTRFGIYGAKEAGKMKEGPVVARLDFWFWKRFGAEWGVKVVLNLSTLAIVWLVILLDYHVLNP